MENYNHNLMLLESIASALGDLLSSVTFVGGCSTILMVEKSAYFGVRMTEDVDGIIDATTFIEYHKFGQALRKQGFREDDSGPVCRWLYDGDSGIVKLDIMPMDEKILGFSNRWYKAAINEADNIKLASGKTIRLVSPTYFIATKFEAFNGRGAGEFFSHDLEDIIFVMENRDNLILDLINSPKGLKQYFAEQAAALLNDDFLNVLPGLLINSESAGAIENTLKIMSSWK